MREYCIWLAKFLTVVTVLVVFVPLLSFGVIVIIAGLSDNAEMPTGKDVVAVIELDGVMVTSKEIVNSLYKQAENERVKGIVLRIDSPGGIVGPSQDIYHAVRDVKEIKPVIVSMGAVAASGGLYAALGATKIYAQRGTITGSIGVIMQFPQVYELAQWAGVDMVTIKSGKFKDIGNSFRDITAEERALLVSNAEEAADAFKNAIVESRGLERNAVEAFSDGRIILGSQAKEFGLIDEFGGVYESARAVFTALETPLKEDEIPELYYPEDKFEHLKRFLESGAQLFGMFAQHTRMLYLMQ